MRLSDRLFLSLDIFIWLNKTSLQVIALLTNLRTYLVEAAGAENKFGTVM